MKVKYVVKDEKGIDVFTIGSVYEVLDKDEHGVVCIDDTGAESVMFHHEFVKEEN